MRRYQPASNGWRAVDVDDQRFVIGGQRFSLPRLTIDLGTDIAGLICCSPTLRPAMEP